MDTAVLDLEKLEYVYLFSHLSDTDQASIRVGDESESYVVFESLDYHVLNLVLGQIIELFACKIISQFTTVPFKFLGVDKLAASLSRLYAAYHLQYVM